MKLRHKLPVAFVAVSLLIACAGLFGIFQLRGSLGTYENVIRVDYSNEHAAASVLLDFKTQVQEWKNTLLRGKDPEQLQKYWSAFQKQEKEVADAAVNLRASLPEGEARSLVEKFVVAHKRMGDDYRKGFDQFKDSGFDPTAGDAAVKGKDREPTELLKQAREKIISDTKESVDQAATSSTRTTTICLVMMLLGFGGAVFAGFKVSRGIVTPIEEAATLAERVSQGDLGYKVDASTADEVGMLILALTRMSDNLSSMVSDIRSNSETMATASSQIATGNLDLSSRTEEQAASLEETASSMEELSATVKQNADNARQANQLAISASEVAVKGGTVVSHVVNTMGSINESSRKIVDIIGVIDGIAFQTNILALNAAVEAARAGEQGRGFAVVASEVRNLAQRSAAAAKEIKALIGDSVEKVDAGSRLVNDAGSTMEEIVMSVRRLTSIIAEIMSASQEQSAGIEQVNQAIAQIGQVTQQNAALVEEASAAAESLQELAGGLEKSVSVFKLSDQLARKTIAKVSSKKTPVRVPPPVSKPMRKAQPVVPKAAPAIDRLTTAKSTGGDWEEF